MNMSFCGRVLLVALLAYAAALGTAQVASADVIHVFPGESIQEAIDEAEPGDTVRVHEGVYHENVAITKNRIRLRGDGQRKTVLMPAGEPTPSPCTIEVAPGVFLVDGICIAGEFDPVTFELGPPVRGTKVERLHVTGFSGFGVILLNANRSTVERVQASHNDGYGISGFVLSRVRFLRNYAHHNHEPGFYVGDSPNARALIVGNRAHDNQMGILLRDASRGLVHHNRLRDNCVGVLVIETGAPDPARRWRLRRNTVRHNNRACEGTPTNGPPPLSGAGIVIAGADRVRVWRNKVLGHEASGPSAFTGGIVVVSSATAGGDAPNNNRIVRNTAFRNEPFDVFWDESGSGNRFRANRCATSDPQRICEDDDD
jgi:parallel beta-helix repeat protein